MGNKNSSPKTQGSGWGPDISCMDCSTDGDNERVQFVRLQKENAQVMQQRRVDKVMESAHTEMKWQEVSRTVKDNKPVLVPVVSRSQGKPPEEMPFVWDEMCGCGSKEQGEYVAMRASTTQDVELSNAPARDKVIDSFEQETAWNEVKKTVSPQYMSTAPVAMRVHSPEPRGRGIEPRGRQHFASPELQRFAHPEHRWHEKRPSTSPTRSVSPDRSHYDVAGVHRDHHKHRQNHLADSTDVSYANEFDENGYKMGVIEYATKMLHESIHGLAKPSHHEGHAHHHGHHEHGQHERSFEPIDLSPEPINQHVIHQWQESNVFTDPTSVPISHGHHHQGHRHQGHAHPTALHPAPTTSPVAVGHRTSPDIGYAYASGAGSPMRDSPKAAHRSPQHAPDSPLANHRLPSPQNVSGAIRPTLDTKFIRKTEHEQLHAWSEAKKGTMATNTAQSFHEMKRGQGLDTTTLALVNMIKTKEHQIRAHRDTREQNEGDFYNPHKGVSSVIHTKTRAGHHDPREPVGHIDTLDVVEIAHGGKANERQFSQSQRSEGPATNEDRNRPRQEDVFNAEGWKKVQQARKAFYLEHHQKS